MAPTTRRASSRTRPNGGEGYFDANYHWDVTNPESKALADLYEKTYGQPIRTSAVLTYDAVWVIAEALEASGTTESAALRSAIAASTYQPLVVSNGPVSFDATGQNTNAAIVVMQIQDGAVRQVYPDAVAEGARPIPRLRRHGGSRTPGASAGTAHIHSFEGTTWS
jgi:branched-chain amino acid transport system substrate-binding protein